MPHNVFLTGVTGFVGRYLLYQLCDADWIDEIYVMMRPKHNASMEERFQDVLNDPLIQAAKKNGTKFEKIFLIAGDCHKPNLGISESDQELLSEKLTLVIHNAAVLNFAGTIQNSLKSNTTPTWELYNMCCYRFKHKPAFVFVSTIATNSHLDPIPEKVTKFELKAANLYNHLKNMPAEQCVKQEELLKEGRLDAYGLSKGIVERMIADHIEETGGIVPVNFLRPGGIISAWNGPLRGWFHHTCFYGILMYQIYEGMLPFFLADGDKDVNMAPVDFVGNLTMCSCLDGLERREKKDFSVLVVNGSKIRVNGLSINYMVNFSQRHYPELVKQGAEHGIEMDPDRIIRKPFLLNTIWIFDIVFNLFVFLPLWLYSFYDNTSYRYQKVYKTLAYLFKFARVLHPYLSRRLAIENGNLDMFDEKYGDRYPVDASHIDTDKFLKSVYEGIIVHILPHERKVDKLRKEKWAAKGSKLKAA